MLSIGHLVRLELELVSSASFSADLSEIGTLASRIRAVQFPIDLDLLWEGDGGSQCSFIHSDSNMALRKSRFNGLFVGWRFHQLVEIALLWMVLLGD